MDSFEWNKIIGAFLGTLIFIFVIKTIAEVVYEAPKPAKPGYVVEGVVENTGTVGAAPVEEALPDFGTVLPVADVNAGKTISARCQQCHDLTKGGPDKIGPNLYSVVGRPRASRPSFSYSSAMRSKGGEWNFDELFKFLRSPGAYIPGTKMSFAGLRNAQDRINVIAYLRTNSDSPVAIPPPAPPKPVASTASEAPADASKTATGKSDAAKTDKPTTPAVDEPAKNSAAPSPGGEGASQPKDMPKPKNNLAPGKAGQ